MYFNYILIKSKFFTPFSLNCKLKAKMFLHPKNLSAQFLLHSTFQHFRVFTLI
jgi:hypothetical protein